MQDTSILRQCLLLLTQWVLGFVLLLSGGYSSAAQLPERLVMGISPWTHQALLFKWGKPIIGHVQKHTEKKVVIGSASDLPTYFKRAKDGRYDAFISPINFGLYLVQEEGFTPLLWVRVGYQSVLVCDKESSHKHLKDLNGETVIFPPAWASTALVMTRAFEKAGIVVEPHYVKDQWEVIEGLLGGKRSCAVILSNLYETKSSKLKKRFIEVYRDPTVMDALLIAPPSTPMSDLEAFKSLATGFYEPGSIVKGFDPLKPSDEKLRLMYKKMEPVMKRFKAMVSDSGGGPK